MKNKKLSLEKFEKNASSILYTDAMAVLRGGDKFNVKIDDDDSG